MAGIFYCCDHAGARTQDPILKRDVLYLLSYVVVEFFYTTFPRCPPCLTTKTVCKSTTFLLIRKKKNKILFSLQMKFLIINIIRKQEICVSGLFQTEKSLFFEEKFAELNIIL